MMRSVDNQLALLQPVIRAHRKRMEKAIRKMDEDFEQHGYWFGETLGLVRAEIESLSYLLSGYEMLQGLRFSEDAEIEDV